MPLSYKNIKPFIMPVKNIFSKWIGYFGLGIGVFLLLVSVQMFVNIQQLLQENSPRKSGGYDFISISKTITNDNMGKDNSFTNADILHLEQAPGIAGVAPLISNKFRVRATAGDIIPFSTDLFLESIDNNYIDTLPPDFNWQPGQLTVPIIFSSDFLEMYNVFAPAQGLPQLSAKTISSVNIILECSGPFGTQNFKGHIVGLSDRINSLLVPKSFLNWSNGYFMKDTAVHASRVYIKTKDANDPKLISYLDQQGYHLNKDKVKFSRIKGFLQNIVSVIGAFGVLVIILALMLFSFYLQLIIAKSKDNLQLLLTLGYSPKWLAKSVAKTWLPVYLFIIIISIIFTEIIHWLFIQLPFAQAGKLSYILDWKVWITAIFLLALTIVINGRLVKKELEKIF
jgi:hypothetical protein